LVRLDACDRPQLFLIDLHDVGLREPLGWRASRDNLVLLNRFFILRVGRTDRHRFWRAYVEARMSGERQGSRGQGKEDRGQKAEEREQRIEDRGQRTKDRGQRTETSAPHLLTTRHSPLTTHYSPPTAPHAREAEAHTWRSNLRFWRRRDRRCLA